MPRLAWLEKKAGPTMSAATQKMMVPLQGCVANEHVKAAVQRIAS